MTIARGRLVDLSVTRWYHCITRCVRQALLIREGALDRKLWIENRLAYLAETFAISVGGFAIMDNHLHLLVRIDPDLANQWSGEEVARRWARLYPPRDGLRRPIEVTREWLDARLKDAGWVVRTRQRLRDLGWFMKSLKEPLARMANREDDTRGAFFEGRYKSIAVLDEEALLAVCTYIDLNPVAAGMAELPEASEHTSIKTRVDHVRTENRLEDLTAARNGNVPASFKASGLEEKHWLCPIEDRRRHDSEREGMIEGFTLGGYLLLLDYSSRLFRAGKATVDRGVEEILTRLGCDSATWHARLEKLKSRRPYGRFLAGTREKLREAASKVGAHHLANVAGSPAR